VTPGRSGQCYTGSTNRPADLAPGELAWAHIINGVENPLATGKPRPVVLIEQQGWAWKTIGLTTNPRYRDGMPRVAIPSPSAVGLQRPGWIWSGRLCTTAGIDIDGHIGWVDAGLALELIKLAGLSGPTVKTLLAAVHEHHGPSPAPELRLLPGGTS
jgi:hypothetical protein